MHRDISCKQTFFFWMRLNVHLKCIWIVVKHSNTMFGKPHPFIYIQACKIVKIYNYKCVAWKIDVFFCRNWGHRWSGRRNHSSVIQTHLPPCCRSLSSRLQIRHTGG